ncbi:MAG: hypothetical protein OEV64_08330, partial [Desulfobulbaceae bacterium]|nr:hypothetical protein [Desulfobulbaceae bacterium]
MSIHYPVLPFIFLFIIANLLLLCMPSLSASGGTEKRYDLTTNAVIKAYEGVPCLSDTELAYGRE